MFAFDQETLIKVLDAEKGVDMISYGRPRDGFALPLDVPHWTSGYGGKYEMQHSHVPAGTMIAIGNLEDIDIHDIDKLKPQLQEIDIYPTGHSGDFTGTNVQTLRQWFTDRSRLDNDVNNQTPIAHAKKLTPAGLGVETYSGLVDYLTDNMNLFKDPKQGNRLVPADYGQRHNIVVGLLDGLSKTVRYTRLDDPAKAFQVTESLAVKKNASAILLSLKEPAKILLERSYKNGEKDVTPLDRAMIGRSYVTADGLPLGDRGSIDISDIALKARELEAGAGPSIPLPYMQKSALGMAQL